MVDSDHPVHGYRIVQVDWLDSTREDGWTDPVKFAAGRDDVMLFGIRSTGYLVIEEPEYVAIASSVNAEGDALSLIAIPRCSITRMLDIEAALVA